MPFETDFATHAGTRLYVCADKPTDNTEVAFEALDWEEITITNVGSIEGREYSTSTLSVVSNAHDKEKKGTYKFPQSEWGVEWNPVEPGQVIAQAASRNYTSPSFKVVRQTNETVYFIAQVMKFTDNGGGGNDALSGNLTLLRQSDTLHAVTP